MGETPPSLSEADLTSLATNASPEVRIDVVSKVSALFCGDQLTASERRIAEDIFRALLKDEEIRVRETLSEHLKSVLDLPHDLALAMARDALSVALPVLQCCEVLTDTDLIEIVGGRDSLKQEAIAGRGSVSEAVSDVLIDQGSERAVTVLAGNEGARLDEGSLGRIIEKYGESASVSQAVCGRASLPPVIFERIIAAVTDQLQGSLVAQLALPEEMVRTLIYQVRRRAVLGLLKSGVKSAAEVEAMVDRLEAEGRLTTAMALDALANENLLFFEMAMARLANIPVENARSLLHDKGSLGLQSILKAVSERSAKRTLRPHHVAV